MRMNLSNNLAKLTAVALATAVVLTSVPVMTFASEDADVKTSTTETAKAENSQPTASEASSVSETTATSEAPATEAPVTAEDVEVAQQDFANAGQELVQTVNNQNTFFDQVPGAEAPANPESPAPQAPTAPAPTDENGHFAIDTIDDITDDMLSSENKDTLVDSLREKTSEELKSIEEAAKAAEEEATEEFKEASDRLSEIAAEDENDAIYFNPDGSVGIDWELAGEKLKEAYQEYLAAAKALADAVNVADAVEEATEEGSQPTVNEEKMEKAEKKAEDIVSIGAEGGEYEVGKEVFAIICNIDRDGMQAFNSAQGKLSARQQALVDYLKKVLGNDNITVQLASGSPFMLRVMEGNYSVDSVGKGVPNVTITEYRFQRDDKNKTSHLVAVNKGTAKIVKTNNDPTKGVRADSINFSETNTNIKNITEAEKNYQDAKAKYEDLLKKYTEAAEMQKQAMNAQVKIARDKYIQAAAAYADSSREVPKAPGTPGSNPTSDDPASSDPTSGDPATAPTGDGAAILLGTVAPFTTAPTAVAGVRRAIADAEETVGDAVNGENTLGESTPGEEIYEEEILGGTEKLDDQAVTLIDDEPLPAAAAPVQKHMNWWWLLILLLVCIGSYHTYKKYREKKEEKETSQRNK